MHEIEEPEGASVFSLTRQPQTRTTLNENEAIVKSFQEILTWPKVELHAHLNGCIREDTLFELAQERGVTLSSHHFAHYYREPTTTNEDKNNDKASAAPDAAICPQMYNTSPRSLHDCFEMFAEIIKAVNDLAALRRITREALEDFAVHHVVYLELRTTPKCLLVQHQQHDKMASKVDYLQTVLQVMEEFEAQEEERYQKELQAESDRDSIPALQGQRHQRLPLKCRLIVAVDRGRSLDEARENIEAAVTLNSPYIVGLDLGGNPMRQDFRLFEPLFLAARRDYALKITLHCAEIPMAEHDDQDENDLLQHARQEAKAILQFQPDRLGHALLLAKDLQQQLILAKKAIPIETCPTSNVMTLELAHHPHQQQQQQVQDAAYGSGGDLIQALKHEHPALPLWLEAGQALIVCTDDPGVFCTTATQELVLFQQAYNVPLHKMRQLVYESLGHAFCSAELKAGIQQRWKQWETQHQEQ